MLETGNKEEQIIIVDLELNDNEHPYYYRARYDYIVSKLLPNKMNYEIIDEVQNADYE